MPAGHYPRLFVICGVHKFHNECFSRRCQSEAICRWYQDLYLSWVYRGCWPSTTCDRCLSKMVWSTWSGAHKLKVQSPPLRQIEPSLTVRSQQQLTGLNWINSWSRCDRFDWPQSIWTNARYSEPSLEMLQSYFSFFHPSGQRCILQPFQNICNSNNVLCNSRLEASPRQRPTASPISVRQIQTDRCFQVQYQQGSIPGSWHGGSIRPMRRNYLPNDYCWWLSMCADVRYDP